MKTNMRPGQEEKTRKNRFFLILYQKFFKKSSKIDNIYFKNFPMY